MSYLTGKVYTFKFNSGEEMIAKVTKIEQDMYIMVENPLSVAPNQNGIGLIPSLFTGNTDKPVTININSIAMYSEVDENVQLKYLEATTGIQVPDKKIIMG